MLAIVIVVLISDFVFCFEHICFFDSCEERLKHQYVFESTSGTGFGSVFWSHYVDIDEHVIAGYSREKYCRFASIISVFATHASCCALR